MLRLNLFVATLVAPLVFLQPAFAKPGDTESGVVALHAKAMIQHHAFYNEISYSSGDGLNVHEYSDLVQHRIFAMSWSGSHPYPLNQIVDPTLLHAALAQRHPINHHALTIQVGNTTIESQVYLRQYFGRAWQAQNTPAGFDARTLP